MAKFAKLNKGQPQVAKTCFFSLSSLFKNVAYDHYAPLFTMRLHAELDEGLTKLLKVGWKAWKISTYE